MNENTSTTTDGDRTDASSTDPSTSPANSNGGSEHAEERTTANATFIPFADKGKKKNPARRPDRAVATLSKHGTLHFNLTARQRWLEGSEYVQYFTATDEGLLGIRPLSEIEAKSVPDAYTISNDSVVTVKRLVKEFGVNLSELDTFAYLVLSYDDEVGLIVADLSKLKEGDDD